MKMPIVDFDLVETAMPVLQTCERFLHPVQVRMLASAHPFVFRTLQGSLIGLPCSEDRKLLQDGHAHRPDYVHGTSEPACGVNA